MTQPPISASHLSLWKRCKRREAFAYRQGRREPTTKPADAGKHVHSLLEAMYHGVPIDRTARWDKYEIGQLATEMAKCLPEPGPDILGIEESFEVEVDGVLFHGIRDLRTSRGVYDHKTTRDLKYAKSLDQLETDVQRLIYTETEPSAEYVQWTTGAWSTFEVYAATLPIDRKLDRERFKLHVLTAAEEMLSHSADVDPLTLPPTESECNVFPPKGCPYKSICFPSQAKVMASISAALRPVSLPAPQPEPVPSPTTGATAYKIDTLFIDCLPLRPLDEPVVSSYDLLHQANQSVADDEGVDNALLIDFGKGPIRIAGEIKAMLESTPIKYLSWESRSTEGRACLNTLVPMARVIVKGIY